MRTLFPIVVALPLLACDPSYTVHLATTVSAHGAPVGGAWVIPLSRSATRLGVAPGVRTAPNGAALLSRTERLHQPADDPIAIRAPDRPLCIVRLGADAKLRGRGIFFVTEYDVDFAVDLAGPECTPGRRVALACGDDERCEVALDEPASSFCDAFIVVVTPATATAALIPEVLASGMDGSPHKFVFARPEGGAFMAVCIDRQGLRSVSVAE